MERFCCRVSGLEASPTMGSGSPEQAETQRVSSDWISNHVACYSHIHFMDREQSRARLLRNSVGLDRVHDSLLSLNALKRCPMLCVNRPSIARMPVWTFGARRNKNAPRNNHGGRYGSRRSRIDSRTPTLVRCDHGDKGLDPSVFRSLRSARRRHSSIWSHTAVPEPSIPRRLAFTLTLGVGE